MDLRKTGVYPYAEDARTDIWCMAWSFDDEEPEIWWPEHVCEFLGLNYSFPQRIANHIMVGGEIRAHNAEFERIIWKHIMDRRYGWPEPKMEQWVCSAAEAAAMSLPRSLDQACAVTGVKQQKDQDGYSLMMRMTRPRKIHDDGTITWWYDKERLYRLGEYCRQDVRAEKALSKVLRRLTPLEREHYLACCRKNDRGIQVDVPLVRAAREVADEGLARANAALEQLTEGAVQKVTNHAKLRQWVNDQGVETDSVAKKAVHDLLESDLDPKVREVLQLRADAGRSSLAKLDSLLACVCTDGKIRGMHLFHGAGTGRETGRLAQVHNFPRPEIDAVYKNVEPYADMILRRAYDEIDLFHPPVAVVVDLLRSMLTASPGHELVAADFAGIEARGTCWIAGQDDALELFARGEDVYKDFASKMWNIPISQVTPQQRQGGKFAVLGCGFGMGAETGMVQANQPPYNLNITLEQTREIVNGYRSTYKKVKQFWRDSNDAAIDAVREPGSIVKFGPKENLIFTKQGAYLYLILPSKRPLVYAAPRIISRELPWSTEEDPKFGPAVEISAIVFGNKWGRMSLYGGLITENIVQAISRDIMLEAKLRVEAAGYKPVLTCHDEIVSEVPLGEGDLKEFIRLLEVVPEWATGWPIKAEGWRGHRYRK